MLYNQISIRSPNPTERRKSDLCDVSPPSFFFFLPNKTTMGTADDNPLYSRPESSRKALDVGLEKGLKVSNQSRLEKAVQFLV
jgi:hypothetical protein